MGTRPIFGAVVLAVALVGAGCGDAGEPSAEAVGPAPTTEAREREVPESTTSTTRPRPTTTTSTTTTTTTTTTTAPPTTTTTAPPPPPPTTTAPPPPPTTTAPPPPPAPEPVAPQPLTGGGGCDPNYTGCVPIDSDVDCSSGSGNGPSYVVGPVQVIGSDIYDLDRDGNGVGCEDG